VLGSVISSARCSPANRTGWWGAQGHWRFPQGKELEGYAYVLTHPGTPSVFYDHVFLHGDIKHKLRELIQVRQRNDLHCRSEVNIVCTQVRISLGSKQGR
jgi:hypothetical protein